MTAPTPVPAGICPGCGQTNQCGMAAPAAGTGDFDCWCMHTEIKPAALASLPADERGLRCLCPSCAQGVQPVHNER